MAAQQINQPARVSQTSRGTIEFVIKEEALQLTPQHRGGVLTSLALNDGTRLLPGRKNEPWTIVTECNANIMALPIKSVSLDDGNLTIKAKQS
jgi:hypothetical protein